MDKKREGLGFSNLDVSHERSCILIGLAERQSWVNFGYSQHTFSWNKFLDVIPQINEFQHFWSTVVPLNDHFLKIEILFWKKNREITNCQN